MKTNIKKLESNIWKIYLYIILSAILSPFIGWIADIYTLEFAFILSGIIVLVLGILTLLLFCSAKSK